MTNVYHFPCNANMCLWSTDVQIFGQTVVAVIQTFEIAQCNAQQTTIETFNRILIRRPKRHANGIATGPDFGVATISVNYANIAIPQAYVKLGQYNQDN